MLPDRKVVKGALRQAGLSSRQVDALLRHGWSALVGETQAETIELREQLDALRAQFNPVAPPSDVS
jgi:3-oxoacyl-(acyl-carrier-protein) synthase